MWGCAATRDLAGLDELVRVKRRSLFWGRDRGGTGAWGVIHRVERDLRDFGRGKYLFSCVGKWQVVLKCGGCGAKSFPQAVNVHPTLTVKIHRDRIAAS